MAIILSLTVLHVDESVDFVVWVIDIGEDPLEAEGVVSGVGLWQDAAPHFLLSHYSQSQFSLRQIGTLTGWLRNAFIYSHLNILNFIC